jgi:hypothetical protein
MPMQPGQFTDQSGASVPQDQQPVNAWIRALTLEPAKRQGEETSCK